MESKTGASAEVVFLDQSPVVRYVRRSPLVNIYIYIFISGLRPLLTRLPSRPFHAILRSVNDGPTLSSINASVDDWHLVVGPRDLSLDADKICVADVRRTPVAAALQTLLAKVGASMVGLSKKIAKQLNNCKTRRRVLFDGIGSGGGGVG